MAGKKKPVIFLAFANEHSLSPKHLGHLPKEEKRIMKALGRVRSSGDFEISSRFHADLETVCDEFRQHRDRIVIFHFGGHADSYRLQLASPTGASQAAHAKGLVTFLSGRKAPQLVFLNACATEKQAEDLLNAGVRAVIATSQAIYDDKACEFAEKFYKSFASGASISKAFDEANAQILLVPDNGIEKRDLLDPEKCRKIGMKRNSAGVEPWKLFSKQEEVNWKLSDSLLHLGDRPDPANPTHLPESPDFFYPLRLGHEVRRPIEPGEREAPILEFPMWIENPERWRKRFEEEPAERVRDRWLNQPGLHAIVGEPGGGKTTLLRHWAQALADMSTPEKLIVPFYIPLRKVTDEGLTAYFARSIGQGGDGLDVSAYLEDEPPHQPVWLFDGLDELPKAIQEDWLKIIERQQRHVCIVTCRTALYSSELRRHFGEPHYLMGLRTDDQKAFLGQLRVTWQKAGEPNFQSGGVEWANVLHTKLQKNEQLTRLAGSPLLLRLIALTNPPNNEVKDLPANRVGFYRDAFEELLRTRTDLDPDDPVPLELTEFLAALAYEVSKDELVAEVPRRTFLKHAKKLSDKNRKMIKQSSILKPMGNSSFQWLHLTFQEWLLAEYLYEQSNLLAAVKNYWVTPQFDEILSLLWGLASEKGRFGATSYLVKQGRLNSRGKIYARSGLRVALHLWKRSGVVLDEPSLELLEMTINTSFFRKAVVALDRFTPSQVLQRLAEDDSVRELVTRNLTDPEIFQKFAEHKQVRKYVAENIDASAAILLRLAEDEDWEVRWNVAASPNAPTEILRALAEDEHEEVRRQVARNPNTPIETLQILAEDEAKYVRWYVIKNPNAHPEWF